MRATIHKFLLLLSFFFTIVFSIGLYSNDDTRIENTARIFKQSCSTTGCHSGRFPSMNLNLEEDKFHDSLINVSSQQLRHLKLVDTEQPEKSYLLLKIKGDQAIDGKQMPLNAEPLSKAEIDALENWIRSLEKTTAIEEKPAPSKNQPDQVKKSRSNKFTKPSFWGTRLINLPTDQSIGKSKFLFQISHRYFPAVEEGYDAFYGLDGPAVIQFGLGYGISDNLSLSLSRSNRFKEVNLTLKWLFFHQSETNALPFSAALSIGGALVTESEPGKNTLRSENLKFITQLSLSHQFSDSLSVLLVPSYSSNTNHWEEASEGTLALGLGARYMFLDDLSFLGEWIPVIVGYKADSWGWGLGIEKKIGGHVFQVFITNSIGMTSAQYLPGGNLKLFDGEFRFGFNIFRWF
jgi:hypothetical protein